MHKSVSIGDLAERAGVSPATVSIVLNNRPLAIRVAERTRDRIHKLAAEMNYRPNHLARAMQRQSTRTIGFICGELANPFYAEMVDDFAALTEERGYRLMTQPTNWDWDRQLEMLELVLTREVDGIVMFSNIFSDQPERVRKICSPSQPLVVLNDHEVTDYSSVYFDLMPGMKELFSHLTNNGYTDIALADDRRFPRKSAAYLAACAQFAVQPRIFDFSFGNEDSIRNCIEAVAAALPEALIVASDLVGVIVSSGLGTRGIRIPDDLAVATIDGTRMAEYYNPPLTSIRQSTRLLAEAALDELFRKMESSTGEVRHQPLPASLRIMQSTVPRKNHPKQGK